MRVSSKLDSSLTKDSRQFRLKQVVLQEGVPEKVLPGDQAAGGAQHAGPFDGDDDLLSKKPRKNFLCLVLVALLLAARRHSDD